MCCKVATGFEVMSKVHIVNAKKMTIDLTYACEYMNVYFVRPASNNVKNTERRKTFYDGR